jgi:hypothetical protein
LSTRQDYLCGFKISVLVCIKIGMISEVSIILNPHIGKEVEVVSITQNSEKKGVRPKIPNPYEVSVMKVRPLAEVHGEAMTFDVFLALNRRVIG